jgi:selenide, water dikinase
MNLQKQESLTNLSIAGGCGCKLDPEALEEILCSLNKSDNKELVVGFDTADDCAVYEYTKDDYLLYTTDFFTPLVDDPYIYGTLAAANAVSDIYAMGGRPLIANAIFGFSPDNVLSSTAQKIMQGGQDTLKGLGCSIVGGHTIVNPQPIFGFSIIGRVAKENLKTNHGAKPGDLLLLTKPIGSGILSNALKLGLLSDEYYRNLISYLLEVNSCGALLGENMFVNALTDVTGFGLAGHALEMCEGGKLSLELDVNKVPIFSGARDLCGAVTAPHSGAVKNYKNFERKMLFKGDWRQDEKYLYCDPQSNGGLLIAIDPEALERVQDILTAAHGRKGDVIGVFKQRENYNHDLIFVK